MPATVDIIRSVMTKAWVTLALVLALSGCNRAPENPEALKQALVEHLSKVAGLNMDQIDLNLTNVQFKGSEATVTATFQPKGSPGGGMSMPYTLERRGDKWAVVKKAGSVGHAESPISQPPAEPVAPGGALPPGHPPLTSGKPAQ